VSSTVTDLQVLVINLVRRCGNPNTLIKIINDLVGVATPEPEVSPRLKAPAKPKLSRSTKARKADRAELVPEDLLYALRSAAAETSIAEVARKIGMTRSQLSIYLKNGARAGTRVQARLRSGITPKAESFETLIDSAKKETLSYE
jgi:hypothetical protein